MKQNIIIIILLSIIFILGIYSYNNNRTISELHTSINGYINDSTYLVTYYSKSIKELKKENAELYNRVKHQDNVSSALQFSYLYKFKTDTVTVNKNDTSAIKVYEVNTDTLSYKLQIKANQIEYYLLDFELNDKFTIINRKDGNANETQITNTNTNGNVDNVTVYTPTKKKGLLNNFVVGLQIGYGINPYNINKPNLYVGFGITYNLLK